MKSTTQPYNDGLLTIYHIGNIAAPGDTPVDGLTTKHAGIPYDNMTVGMNRFWQGKQLDIRITRLLRCPRLSAVNPLDVVTTEDGQTYRIEQIQWPKDIEPPSMDLSLSAYVVAEDTEVIP